MVYRDKGTGRPTKKERRVIDKLNEDFNDHLKWWYKDLILLKKSVKVFPILAAIISFFLTCTNSASSHMIIP